MASRLLAVTVGLLAIGLIAACGDDDDDDATATEEATAEAEATEAPDAGDNPVAVQATEFEFSFEDGAFTTETTGIVFTNAGEQPHELVVATACGELDGGGTLDDMNLEEIKEFVRLFPDTGHICPLYEGSPEDTATEAGPGDEGALDLKEPLESGRYLMLCYVIDEESGAPHAALGMISEFTIE